MIRYRYQTQLTPPAPFVMVTVRNPLTGAERTDVPAQLDTAADRTLIPDRLADDLGLQRSGTLSIGGVGGVISAMALHYGELDLPGQAAVTLEFVASAGESWMLLGHDVLNGVRVVLDGPNLLLDFG